VGYYCDDWDHINWRDADPDCVHEIKLPVQKESEVKEKYYFMRDPDNRPIVTVCLLQQHNCLGMGIAICSETDNPSKQKGRNISYGRAFGALKKRKSSQPILRGKAWSAISQVDFEPITLLKSNFYTPPYHYLTEREKKILDVRG
jgi:hypothetical protein